ncbi:MAG: hypothetical protein C4523_03910 [Myxococcales bacterium]|nr:MAG: hypothetical protein C4523_03910 [Myxococcales bacterium]
MRKMAMWIGVAAMLVFGTAAQAQTSWDATVTVLGANTYGSVDLYRDGQPLGNIFAGEFNLDVNGENFPGYCVELGVLIYANVPYPATATVLPAESPWCEVSYILQNYEAADGFWGMVIQVAIWKLIDSGSDLYTDHAYVEQYSDELVAEATGMCPLLCTDSVDLAVEAQLAGGEVQATVTLTQAGQPMEGQQIAVSAEGGAILSPSGGVGTTDADGQLLVTIAPQDGATTITVSAQAVGHELLYLDLGDALQDLTILNLGSPCDYSASASVELTVGYGDPRTIGFWKHQVSGCGRPQVARRTIESWLPLQVFDVRIASFRQLRGVLDLGRATMRQRAVQQCTATKLNIAYGELSMGSWVDTDGDGAGDSTVADALDFASDAYFARDYETAKDICDTINNL